MTTSTLGIVGVGKLASFMVTGIRRSGDKRPIILSPRDSDTAYTIAHRRGCVMAESNQAVVDASEVVIISTPPKDALITIRALAWRPSQLLICVAIDVELAQLQEAAAGVTIVRAMPTAASAIGLGSTPIFPAEDRARALFSLVGDVFDCPDEARFTAATALSVYHLWTYALMERMAQAAEKAGLPRATAVGLVAGFTQSAGAFARAADPLLSMRQPLDLNGTPGTMTAQGLAVIEAADALAPWAEAFAVAVERARG